MRRDDDPLVDRGEPRSLGGAEVLGTNQSKVVGQLLANPFGLGDVLGNVSEWCRDVFAHHVDARLPGTGKRAGLGEVEHRIHRGGAFLFSVLELPSARRNLESSFERRLDTEVEPGRALERWRAATRTLTRSGGY